MSTSTNTSLFNALGFFLENMRPYVIAVIQKAAPGRPWEGELFTKLGPDQQRVWNMAQRNLQESGGNTANLIDYNILFSFGVAYKDALKLEVGSYNDANKLINYFKELKEVRNKCQHYQELDEDEITRAYLNMKGAAKLLEMQDVYDEIQRLQNGDNIISTPTPSAQPVQTQSFSLSPTPTAAVSSDEILPSWFNNCIPHYDIRNAQLDESIFAANLSEVAMGTGPDVYTNPNLFFAKTYVTSGLRDISTRVIQALNGEETENRVISLQTGFGGGKTHSLISLYHIAKSGSRIAGLGRDLKLFSDNVTPKFDDAKVAVFTHNTTDILQGRVTDEGFTIYTLWGELAYQLGGKEAYEKVKQNDVERIAPTSTIFKPILDSNTPSLILIDELADYCVKAADKKIGQGTLFNQTNSFIQTLTEMVASVPRCVLIVTLPASATEVSASAIGQQVLSSLETRVVRVGTSVTPVDNEEIFEVVRRRLFEQIIDSSVIDQVARKYQDMYHNRRGDLPPQADNTAYANKIRKSYPFQPELIDMFRLRWGNDPRFQRTRGVLRLLASIVQDLWKRRNSLVGTQALIHTSDLNLENLNTITGTINNLMGSNWDTVMHADVYGSSSNAYKIDNLETSGNAFTYRITQGVATSILLASVGGDHQHGLSMAELKLCMLRPGAFNHNDIDGVLNKLESVAHYLYSSNTGGKRYWFQSKANINILLNQAKSEVTVDEMNVEILNRLKANSFINNGLFRVLVNPNEDIPEQTKPTLIVMHPKYSAAIDHIDSATERFVKQTATKRGLSERQYRNTILYLACSDAGRAQLNVKLGDYIACTKILSEYATALEKDQKTDIENRKHTYDRELEEALVQAYSVVLKHSAKEGIHRYNFQEPSRDLLTLITISLPTKLKEEEWLLDSVGRRTLSDNNLLPTVDNPVSVKLIYEAFLKYDDKPMISGPEAIERSVCKYCEQGVFNVAAGTPGDWTKIYVGTDTIPFLSAQTDEFWLVDTSVVPKPAGTPEQPEQPGESSGNGGSETPGPDGPGGGTIPGFPPEGGETVKEFKSIIISGNVDMASWTQLMSSFISPLRNNNLRLSISFKAKSTDMSPLTENSPLFRAVKESASQLGLDIETEEE